MKRSLGCATLVAILWHGSSAAFAAAGASLSAQAVARTAVAPIAWRPCTPDLVDEAWTAHLGARLECGTMRAALDKDAPGRGSLDVGLVRFRAGDPTRREGSIFFNFGGPGGNPLDFLPSIGYLWATRSADHPLDGDKRRLADRFDLVAVIPRGLRGGTGFSCPLTQGGAPRLDPSIYLGDWNWKGFVDDARAYARSCATDPIQAYLGTMHHVHDMEQARLALGEPVMNFMGISYGSWVGAYYAATYPERTGRIVLDSVGNYAGTFEDQLDDYPYERQALFAQRALRPALADPAAYGLGTDAGAVMSRFRAMPYRAREAWATLIDSPADLAAALVMADWVHEEGDITGDGLIARIARHSFSQDVAAAVAIRNAAIGFAADFEAGTADDPRSDDLIDSANYLAVVCADAPWRKDTKALRTLANTIAGKYPAADGDSVLIGLTCIHWPAIPDRRPSLAALAKAPPMLLVQAEFDPLTPSSGAMKALAASPRSHMVLARNASVHGLFGASATPCVERAVGRFLLSGQWPAERVSGCDFVPAPPHRVTRDADTGPEESEVRAELARRLRHGRGPRHPGDTAAR